MNTKVWLRTGTVSQTGVSLVMEPEGARVNVQIRAGDAVGGLGSSDSADLAKGSLLALEHRVPLVIEIEANGPDVEEGLAALDGWGQAARAIVKCSGVVPTIAIVTGPVVAGPSLLLGLVDIVVMVGQSYAFVGGPRMVTEFTGVPISTAELGGSPVHDRTSGLASFTVDTVDEASELVATLLGYLPSSTDALPNQIATTDPTDRQLDDVYQIIPDSPTGSYDVRDVIAEVVDDAMFLEPRHSWAPNLVTLFATIDGHPIGVVANQPQSVAGTLDIAASQKGGRFVSFCDAFNLPILTFVDTSGFYPGKDLEWRGMIRYGAQFAFAYARATVPRVAVTLRKSYGGAYIVMDSKYMGNDLSFAWPSAEIAVMGAKGAVEILHRNADEQERDLLETEYKERLLNPYIAAERGSIEAVIDPADTRRQVSAALEVLQGKRERLPRRRHDNTPL
ncbi:MAG: carboxyl transferase domain-containing protein [Acidimicrobiales bacterium]